MAVAASLGLAALGWVVSPVVKDLVTKSITYLGSNIAEGLKDLETTLLPQFQLTIQAAQSSPHAAQLNQWLLRLKNAYYDAEAILHELEYKRIQRKVKGDKNKTWVRISSHPIIKPLAKFTSKINKKVSPLSPKKRELWQRLTTLKKVAAEAKDLRELLRSVVTENGNSATTISNPPVTSSLLSIRVFGRDGERDKIINFLLDKNEKGCSSCSSEKISYPVVAVTGIGGAGKTTLAQYVYNDERVKQHFGALMWVCLSQKMNVMEHTRDMIECITKKRSDLTNLNELQNDLMKAVKSEPKGIFLVLDNFWAHDTEAAQDEQWRNLLAPFHCIRGKFKILITSRSDKFPVSLVPEKHINLSDLTDAHFLSLFRYYAGLPEISNVQCQNDIYYEIGDRIVSKLSKSPLAARTVGDQLYKNQNTQFWQNTERNVNLSDTMKVLLWSFQLMDVPLQRCFLFCGVFPKNVWYTGYDLGQYWIALDLIQPLNNNKSLEDIGSDYFQMMVKSSIFQLVNGKYYMHDLYIDLIEQLSAGDCFRVEEGERYQISPTTLHLFFNADGRNLIENLSSLRNLSNLRTLILQTYFIKDLTDIFSIICTNLKNLRILDIWSNSYEILPRVVGDLKNLRYLNVWSSRATKIKELPDSVSQLYHLQYLILPSSVKTLPTNLSNLINLRSVGNYDRDFIHVSLPPVPYLGKLTSLQHLDEFHVRKEKGFGLEQLGFLGEIGGSLRIVNLENVRNEYEAVAARLHDKSKLEGLELVWAGRPDHIDSELEVITALKPPERLSSLTIDGYSGSIYPTWLQDGTTIPNLAHLQLVNCNALTTLPSNFHQFRHCSELILDNLGVLTELPVFPKNLARLQISKCPSLILVHENDLQVNEYLGIMGIEYFPFPISEYKEFFRHELASFNQTGSMRNCMEQFQIIRGVAEGNGSPEMWENTESVVAVSNAWWCCHQQRMKFLFCGTTRANILKSLPFSICTLHLSYCCISDGALSNCLKGMATLGKLYLDGIMTITTLPPAYVLQSLKSLRDLKMSDCWCLRSLSGLHALPQLYKIDIMYCSEISRLPELPSSVQHIEIGGCPVLKELCQPDGPEWHKIQHIHRIKFLD